MSCIKIIKDKRSEVQLKIPRTYHLTPIRMATILKNKDEQKMSVGEEVEKLEHLCTNLAV